MNSMVVGLFVAIALVEVCAAQILLESNTWEDPLNFGNNLVPKNESSWCSFSLYHHVLCGKTQGWNKWFANMINQLPAKKFLSGPSHMEIMTQING